MIEHIPGSQNVESETDLVIVNKLNDVISEVNSIEAKLQSASPTNSDYTAVLRAKIGQFFSMFDNECLHESKMDKLAAHLNAALQKQHCA